MKKIRVLIVDDSPIARGVLGEIIGSAQDMEVIRYAPDGQAAIKFLSEGSSPQADVVTLDVEMPRMSGLEVLKEIIARFSLPVVMVAGANPAQANRTIQALSMGAVEFIEKHHGGSVGLEAYRHRVLQSIRAAQLSTRPTSKTIDVTGNRTTGLTSESRFYLHTGPKTSPKLVVVGASTGGTDAIRILLSQLPPTGIPVVVAVHMPAFFTASFANRLDGILDQTVLEACDGQDLQRGHVYIAPGGCHLRIRSGRGGRLFTQVENGKEEDIYKPCIDHLFHSAAVSAGAATRAFILTGMGNDGTSGSLAIAQSGGRVWAQSEESCVVYGMPRSAYEAGAVEQSLEIERLAGPLRAEQLEMMEPV